MPKATPSFVLTLRLETREQDEHLLEKRFRIGSHIYNVVVKQAQKRVRRLKQDKRYNDLMEKRTLLAKSKKDNEKAIREIDEELKNIRAIYGLGGKYSFDEYVKVQQRMFRKHIDSLTAQKIASSVWKSVEKHLFSNGKHIHFRKFKDFTSMEGKTNTSGIRYQNGHLRWNGLSVPVRIKDRDIYAKECIETYPIKYCRIMRRWHKHNYRYYVQIVFKGIPPQKHRFDIHDDRKVGIDPGTSTMAVVSNKGVLLNPLAEDVDNVEKEIKELLRKVDRQRRSNNPQNYNEDGTIRRDSKNFHKKWRTSARQKHNEDKIKMLYRKRADKLKQSHERLANRILHEYGTDIYTEKMNYKGLQKRAQKTEISEKTGRYKRKKRFGKSLSNHAPSMFLNILDRKLSYIGKNICYIDTRKMRLSQLNHITGEYEKASLSKRWKKLTTDTMIQRDLYSAFLIQHMVDQENLDFDGCSNDFNNFKIKHDEHIKQLKLQKEKGRILPSCMGI